MIHAAFRFTRPFASLLTHPPSLSHAVSLPRAPPVLRRYPSFPVFANLRCGLWYVGGEGLSDPELGGATWGTCYYKSTDGHNNNWSFSATRLNLHVAEAAAAHGGVVVVDATRSTTKRFPDAFSKTIPIWAEVLSRAVAAGRDGDGSCSAASETYAWDAGPHLPLWVSDHERNSIRARMPGFLDTLRSVQPSLGGLSASLRAPLRCVWVSQETTSLPCVDIDPGDPPPFVPIVLISASAPLQWHGERRSSEEGYPFAYIPGAGDDEESWARGLTPVAFWRNRHDIMRAGPGGCDEVMRRVVVRERSDGGDGSRLVGPNLGRAAGEGRVGASLSVPPSGLGGTDGRDDAGDVDCGADLSCLVPKGCLSPAQRAAATRRVLAEGGVSLANGGVRWLEGEAGALAIAAAAALARPETWAAVDAVLYCGAAPPPLPPGFSHAPPADHTTSVAAPASGEEMPRDAQPPVPAPRMTTPKPYLHVPMRSVKVARSDVADGLRQALAFIEGHAAGSDEATIDESDSTSSGPRRVLVACGDGVDHSVGVAVGFLVQSDVDGEHGFRQLADDDVPPPVSKELVRRRLADVSARHPEARPSRGTLKQVYNYLLAEQQRRLGLRG